MSPQCCHQRPQVPNQCLRRGWSDLDLGHGFQATKQGERNTFSEFARSTVICRLLSFKGLSPCWN